MIDTARTRRRRVVALTWAIVAGLALALLDSSPGFDATGITAVGLVATGVVAALMDGSGALAMALVYAMLPAGWIFVLEQTTAAGAGALVFATAGAVGTAVLIHLARSRAEALTDRPPGR